jgi:hypothetical protein
VSDRPTPVGALLRAAPPDRIPEVAAEHLRRHFAADRVEILLGDLTLTGLWTVLDPGSAGGGQLAQRCFGSQRPVVDRLPAGSNARRSGANIVEQAELASDAVYSRHGGAAHAATLLLDIDLVGGGVEAVDAGSPRAMIAREGEIRPVTLEQQLPLGMFDEIRYETQRFRLEPGDRLLVVSDGVHAAAPDGRAPYGESALLTALRRTRLQPATEAVGTVMRSLHDYHAGTDPTDDAVTVCLDWRR